MLVSAVLVVFIARTNTQTDRITDDAECFTLATVVGVSNFYSMCVYVSIKEKVKVR